MAFWSRFGKKKTEEKSAGQEQSSGLHHQLRYQVEFHLLPELLEEHAQVFIGDLEAQKGEALARFYRNLYARNRAFSPYEAADFVVAQLPAIGNRRLLRIEMPKEHLLPPLCARVYLVYDNGYNETAYYTLEMSMGSRLFAGLVDEKKLPPELSEEEYMMCAIERRNHVNYGKCMPEEIEGRIKDMVLRGQ